MKTPESLCYNHFVWWSNLYIFYLRNVDPHFVELFIKRFTIELNLSQNYFPLDIQVFRSQKCSEKFKIDNISKLSPAYSWF